MIHIWKDNTKKNHEDILLSIDELDFVLVADSYYFAIDNLFVSNNKPYFHATENLGFLIAYWIRAIQKLKVNELVFLPFEFSDQYIGCFKIEKLNVECDLRISYGYTIKFNGTTISPSNFRSFVITENDFKSTVDPFIKNEKLVVEDLNKSIQGFGRINNDREVN